MIPIPKDRVWLLLTATITPMANLPAFARSDPVARLRDYEAAFDFYLGLLATGQVERIIFAENSLSDVCSLVQKAETAGLRQRVQFVSFGGLDFPPERGRGYGEFRMVDRAIEESGFIQESPGVTVWKCTGRYVIRNIDRIIAKAPRQFDIYCHCRNYPYRLAELYLIGWNLRGYRAVISGMADSISADHLPAGGYTHEVLFRRLIDGARGWVSVAPRFADVPLI